MQANEPPAALSHLRVLELPGRAGAYCGKLLADLGADVIKIEPPGGDPGRFVGPYAGDLPDPDRSLPFINHNTNKRSAVLDLDTEEGRQQLRSLVPTVDVVIESYVPGTLDRWGLGYEALRTLNPGIVLTSITPFGQYGMYSQYTGSDLIATAMSGWMTVQGDPDMPPCTAPLEQATQLACIHGALATLYVLYQRPATGTGDHVDISIQEVVAHMNFPIARYDLDVEIMPRPGHQGLQAGINAYQVTDGWVHIYMNRWERLAAWLKVPEMNDPKWMNRDYREAHWEEGDRLVQRVLSTMTKQQAATEGQATSNPTAPISTTADFVNSPHVQARGFFIDHDHPVLGHLRLPGAPFRMSETPWRIRRSVPRLGEHTVDVLAEAARPRPAIQVRSPVGQAVARVTDPKRPFTGIRVLDFTIAFAGPFATRYLAELGAEVIKVESNVTVRSETHFRQTFPGGRNATTMEINRSKRSITLDLHYPKAQEIARKLAAISDIAIDNFRPGTLSRWNLGYEHLRKVKPDIIMVEMPGFGNTGPHASYISLGQTLTAYSGLMRLWGHPESPENKRGKLAYPDWIGASKAAYSILAALHYRERTGKGQYIEVAQVEGTAAMIGVAYLDYLVNGRTAEPAGNRSVTYAPHNVYPCRGDDRWVAVAITTDEEWTALCRAIGAEDWLRDEELASAAGRKRREAELDGRLGQWTRQYTPHQAMRLLQRAGVPAGAVQNGEDLYFDPHLRERGYIITVDQPYLGRATEPGLTMRFKHTPEETPRGMPEQGEANEYVFGELLGMGRAEREALAAEGVLR